MTAGQVTTLHNHWRKRDLESWKNQARIMGAEFKDEPKVSRAPVESEQHETPTMFGDPESYEHLPMEERKAMTERMKGQFQGMLTLRRWNQENKNA